MKRTHESTQKVGLSEATIKLLDSSALESIGPLRQNTRRKFYLASAGLAGAMAIANIMPSCWLQRDGLFKEATSDGGPGGTGGTGLEGGAGNGGTAGNGGIAGTGGTGLEGGGGAGATGGTGGTGLEGGGGAGATGGTGGAGGAGGGCAETTVSFTDMAEYELKAYQTSCAGPVVATSLGNANFETGNTDLCLASNNNYKIIVQVKDAADLHSVEIQTPQGTVTSAKVTTLGATTPIDNSTADSLCNAGAGWTTLDPLSDDKNPASGNYKFNGNTEGDAGLPNSNAFEIDLSL